VNYVLVVGENEIKDNAYTLKNLNEEMQVKGTIEHILTQFTDGII